MKFGKSLSNQIEKTLPEWGDKFLSYKELKKRLKLISSDRASKRARISDGDSTPNAHVVLTPEMEHFMGLLEAELDKFNSFFLEKEEEYVIRQKELQDLVAKTAETVSAVELARVKKDIVDFHGELVLLEHYSAFNYTGLVKIVKKFDKRTGALIRLPFIQRVLQQPFFTTDLLFKLVKECEVMLDRLFPINEPSVSGEEGQGESTAEQKRLKPAASLFSIRIPGLEEMEHMEKSMYVKSTVAALIALKEIRSGSSTVSEFSLPPLPGNGLDDWCPKMLTVEPANE